MNKIYKYKNRKKEYLKEWADKNRNKINLKNRVFYKNNREKELLRKKLYREKNSEKLKLYRSKNKDKLRKKSQLWYFKNKEKASKYSKEWYKKNKDKSMEYARKWKKNNHDKIYFIYVKYKYKINKIDYENLLISQNNKCKICNETFVEKPNIDHDHKTNKIRGLLCRKCNFILGNCNDDVNMLKKILENSINYLQQNKLS